MSIQIRQVDGVRHAPPLVGTVTRGSNGGLHVLTRAGYVYIRDSRGAAMDAVEWRSLPGSKKIMAVLDILDKQPGLHHFVAFECGDSVLVGQVVERNFLTGGNPMVWARVNEGRPVEPPHHATYRLDCGWRDATPDEILDWHGRVPTVGTNAVRIEMDKSIASSRTCTDIRTDTRTSSLTPLEALMSNITITTSSTEAKDGARPIIKINNTIVFEGEPVKAENENERDSDYAEQVATQHVLDALTTLLNTAKKK